MPPFDLQAISGADILIGLIVTASVIVLIADWRLALFALAFQYVLMALLLSALLDPSLAILRVASGGFAAMMLYITMRQNVEKIRAAQAHGEMRTLPPIFIVGFPFRLFAVALVAVGIIGIASSMTFLGLPSDLLFSSLWLIAIGMLAAILSRDVMRLGLGILVFTGGFCILDTAIEGSLFLYGLINISDLLLALIIAHLATLPGEGTGRRRGETS